MQVQSDQPFMTSHNISITRKIVVITPVVGHSKEAHFKQLQEQSISIVHKYATQQYSVGCKVQNADA